MAGQIRGIRPVGDRAVLVELDDLAEVLSLQAQLREHPLDGQLDVLAAAETVLVTAVSPAAASGFAARLRRMDLGTVTDADATLVIIDTVYDGEDLARVAELTGLGADGVIAAHSEQTWTAAFGGFAPGFAYLVGEATSLAVPRRTTPRSAVPAGSVALADTYSAVYPRASPGGWQLIGRTTALMWDLGRDQPALVRPGNRVRFRPVRELVLAAGGLAPGLTAEPVIARADRAADGVIVRSPGLQTTVQDLGREGRAALGVPGSGALDRGALRRANRLAGNPAGAAGLENALGGLALEAVTDQVLAVTGARVPLTVTGPTGARTVQTETPFALLAGETLTLGAPSAGVRSYVAFRGGLDVPPVLGSRSTDTLSGIGPRPLGAGTPLPVLAAPPSSVVGAPGVEPEPPAAVTDLRFVPGPRSDWFDPETIERFAGATWTVTAQSNRIGLRLDGEPLERSRPGELPSEGTVTGAIQLPSSGLPVLFLADHPVTGGYPVIGVVLPADLDRAAQLPTGARIRFTPAPGADPLLPSPGATPARQHTTDR
ncbi:5-oxoprolinase/urea amidolyase family protein [Cryobacterium tagatosivorans]|uniref:5-oxoprolinase/urea amidolyase family protein n=1 Tax=Cryobacterium tagatosivorans TaxID=1259199 RepID=A0A4R8UHR4_9MICO|nr:5-oxoprolinase/urea amidolyase family protein [Cryobacterium tagatosivorans]TFB53265.1 5-oxoprolinase/urea amidolyase family protein [Cryobacterium tagatosivorans]